MKNKPFKIIIITSYLIFTLLFILFNLIIFHNGKQFAVKHDATRYEIDYHSVKLSQLGTFDNSAKSYHPSFFRYYGVNQLGEEADLILLKTLTKEYEAMNFVNDRLFEGLKLLSSINLIISFIGLFYSIVKRRHSLGYFIGIILSFTIFGGYGMLSILTYFYSMGFFISIYLVYKSRFIDYNESRNIFKRIKGM